MNTPFLGRGFIILLSIFCAAPAWADGAITHLSGEVSVKKADGTTLPGATGIKVNESDTMITGGNGYARLEMSDGGEMVLRPNSQLKVETYRFNPDKPGDDSSVFSMLKGGLRTVTGLIGKRGNKDAYELKTKTATVGIRGTQFDMRLCQGDCGSLADGTYLAVRFGSVRTGNAQGSVDVAAGQVALVQQAKPPVMLPRDPGIGFTPPAVIPKLDEKKKVQAAATAEAAKTEQAKPAASSAEKPSKPGAEGGEKKDSKSSETSDKKSASDKSNPESGKETKESGSSDSGKKPGSDSGGKSGSDSGVKSESPSQSPDTTSGSGSGGSGNSTTQGGTAPATDGSPAALPAETPAPRPLAAPMPQAAPVTECSVQ